MRFSLIPGHTALKTKLATNVDEGRVAHAQLFLGTDGAGLLPLAMAYAQYLFCESRANNDSCGECKSCQKVSSFNHPDLHFSFPFKTVAKKKETSQAYSVEWREQLEKSPYFNLQDWNERCDIGNSQPIIPAKEAKEISAKLSLKSFEGGSKVLIMWHAEMLNGSAANQLLKLIEEPPNGTVIILISDQHDQLIKTITSRTQLVKVSRISDEELIAFLIEKEGMDSARALSVVTLSEGSYIAALNHLGKDSHDLLYFNHFQTWMRICYQKKVVEAFNWADTFSGIGREHQKQILQYCLKMARQCILGNYTAMQMVNLQGEEREFLNKFATFINHKNVIELTNEFNDAHYHIERNANPKILFTDLSIKVIRLLRKQ